MRKFLLATAASLVAIAAALALVAGNPASSGDAASHRDAPLITEDPTADNTDVYAFVSTENGRSDHVTLIANYIPLEEPGEGPNYYRFSDSALYEIMVDINGDAREDVTYQFDFDTNIGAVTPNTFLYNTGAIGLPPNPSNPSSQYTNLNQPQSYDLTFVRGDHARQPMARKAPERRAHRADPHRTELDRQRVELRRAGERGGPHARLQPEGHSRLRRAAR